MARTSNTMPVMGDLRQVLRVREGEDEEEGPGSYG